MVVVNEMRLSRLVSSYIIVLILGFCLFAAPLNLSAVEFKPRVGSVSVTPPAQLVKQKTASNYLMQSRKDVDVDGVTDIIVGANCIEGFCENYIFKILKNNRYRFIGQAKFNQQNFELVNDGKKAVSDILFFEGQNSGQGCLGRYVYVEKQGYQLGNKTCRLPKSVSDLLLSYRPEALVEEALIPKRPDPDFIDFSDLEATDARLLE